MKIKHVLLFVLLLMLFAVVPLEDGGESGTAECSTSSPVRVEIKTDKKYYLMDPYYWVYSAAKFRWWYPPYANPNFWPEEGYTRTVNFTVYLKQSDGSPADVGGVVYQVVYGGNDVLTVGDATYAEAGVYTGSFVLSESNLGGASFTGQQPRKFIIQALVDDKVVKREAICVGRWGCDRCHISQDLARQLYPWSYPSGGPLGPHYWGNILGRNDPSGGTDPLSYEGFDLSYLVDVAGAVYTAEEKTHTPHDYLTAPPDLEHELPGYHERTNVKQGGNVACTPCHQGSGRVRYPWGGTGEYPWLGNNRSLTVKCTFCHGIEGGYTPSGLLDWPGNYAQNWTMGSKWVHNSGFSALHGDCTNACCHGHISDTAEGEIDCCKPACRDCHAVP